MTIIESRGQVLADTLAQEQKLLAEIRAEYNAAVGNDKERLFYLMKDTIISVGQSEAALEFWLNPPLDVFPDLSPTFFTLRWHTDKMSFDFNVLVYNGGAPVSGPFKIKLGVDYVSDNQQDPALRDTAEILLEVPATTVISTQETYRSEYFLDVPFLVLFGERYTTTSFFAEIYSDDQTQIGNQLNWTDVHIRPPQGVILGPPHDPIT